jgi:hypothetical protein
MPPPCAARSRSSPRSRAWARRGRRARRPPDGPGAARRCRRRRAPRTSAREERARASGPPASPSRPRGAVRPASPSTPSSLSREPGTPRPPATRPPTRALAHRRHGARRLVVPFLPFRHRSPRKPGPWHGLLILYAYNGITVEQFQWVRSRGSQVNADTADKGQATAGRTRYGASATGSRTAACWRGGGCGGRGPRAPAWPSGARGGSSSCETRTAERCSTCRAAAWRPARPRARRPPGSCARSSGSRCRRGAPRGRAAQLHLRAPADRGDRVRAPPAGGLAAAAPGPAGGRLGGLAQPGGARPAARGTGTPWLPGARRGRQGRGGHACLRHRGVSGCRDHGTPGSLATAQAGATRRV